jgi:hypothetical protein
LSFSGKWTELENIILSEVSRFRKPKAAWFSYMWDRDPIQMQAMLWKQATLRGGHIWEREGKKKTKKMNIVDIFPVQEWI